MTDRSYRLRGIEARYLNRAALSIDDLQVSGGKLNVIAGENGSGKSTLLRVLALLMKPAEGTVEFCGSPVSWNKAELLALRRRITLVDQEPLLFRGSVEYNVAYGPKTRGLRGDALIARVRESLAMVGLSGFESRHAHKLSGGEARRVALARALACDAEVMLLDEPLAYVDAVSTEVIERLLVALVQRGVLVVTSSHDPTLGTRLNGRTVYLNRGTVAGFDPPAAQPDAAPGGGTYARV